MIVEVASLVAGGAGLLYGLRQHRELRKWARMCNNARITIAVKRKVRLNAPITEWITWANQIDQDESTTGRVIFVHREVSIALLRPVSTAKVRTTIKRVRNRRKNPVAR